MKKLIILFVSVALSQVLAQANETKVNDTDTSTCGQFKSPCKISPYRSYDGSCNNLENPRWGTPGAAYARLIANNSYSDGIHAWPRSSTNKSLMNPRKISFSVSPDVFNPNPIWNVVVLQWGQIVAHDMSFTDLGKTVPKCCTNGLPIPPKTNPRCMPIPIPDDDPFFAPEGSTCFDFVRTASNEDNNCNVPGNTEEPISVVTSYIDLSLVYGSDEMTAKQLRTINGKMKSSVRKGQHWLPPNPSPGTACNNRSPFESCYVAGDTRVNQNPHLSVLQTALLRQHNTIADKLQALNPHWNDEKLYQETRRILIAMAQHIIYHEFIYIYIGKQNVIKKGLDPVINGYVNDYNPKINPQIINEHATAAFRNPHSEIVGYLKRYEENRQNFTQIRLSDWIDRPSVIEEDMSGLALGLSTQPQYMTDRFYDSEITLYFQKKEGKILGDLDLRSVDIQRGRDHGVASYIDVLVGCGNPKPNSFDDLTKYISPKYVQLLKQTYETLEDVELTVAGILETNLPGALMGPTFACIVTEQFSRSRFGDRFFYTNKDNGLTEPQLKTIKNASMARLLCDNVSGVKSMQPDAFLKISPLNPVVPCSQLPQVDLKYWKETPKKGAKTKPVDPLSSAVASKLKILKKILRTTLHSGNVTRSD